MINKVMIAAAALGLSLTGGDILAAPLEGGASVAMKATETSTVPDPAGTDNFDGSWICHLFPAAPGCR